MKNGFAQACLLWLLVLFALPSVSAAQSFAIDRFVLSGGGGTSTNASFRLTGSIAQPDATPALSSARYTVEGGFWSVAVAVQMPDAPLLGVTRTGNNATFTWPAGSEAFILEVTGSLAAPLNWQPVGNATGTSLTLPIPPGASFYRLRKP